MPSGPDNSRFGQRAALLLGIGAAISSPIAGGVLLGYFFDHRLGTSPWLSVTGLIVGSVGAILGVLRILRKIE
ncbi:MAG: AtpZ/AtpI family protein [Blastocatellia bacterium]